MRCTAKKSIEIALKSKVTKAIEEKSVNLDAENNGLTYVIDKFKEQGIAGHITLLKGERSPLASLAAKVL